MAYLDAYAAHGRWASPGVRTARHWPITVVSPSSHQLDDVMGGDSPRSGRLGVAPRRARPEFWQQLSLSPCKGAVILLASPASSWSSQPLPIGPVTLGYQMIKVVRTVANTQLAAWARSHGQAGRNGG